MSKTLKIVLLIFGAAALVVIYGKINPERSVFFPKCPFKLVTGLDCPGCGSQRAAHHLLNGNMISAVKANVLFVIAIPYVFCMLFVEMFRNKNKYCQKIYMVLSSTKAIWIILTVIILHWILRIVYSFLN